MDKSQDPILISMLKQSHIDHYQDYCLLTIQSWKNPLIRSPWRVPHAAGRVEILSVSNVNY